jgi:hypothetical protein
MPRSRSYTSNLRLSVSTEFDTLAPLNSTALSAAETSSSSAFASFTSGPVPEVFEMIERDEVDEVDSTLMVEDTQIYVAPTDIDLHQGVVWLKEVTSGLFKPVLAPCSLVCAISFRPALASNIERSASLLPCFLASS